MTNDKWGGKPTRRVGVLRLPHGIPTPTPTRGGEFEGAKPPFGACADGPKDVSDAANGRGRGSRGKPLARAKRSLV